MGSAEPKSAPTTILEEFLYGRFVHEIQETNKTRGLTEKHNNFRGEVFMGDLSILFSDFGKQQ